MRHLTVLFLAGFLLTGCGVDPDNPGTTNPDGGDNGGGGGTTPNPDDPPFPKEQACHEVSEQASIARKPVDIIIVIDNSGSMSDEIRGVERNINENFAGIIEQSGVDYRVILVAKHGSAETHQSICISAPLSGTSCEPIPAAPANTERFRHYDTEISSTNSLSQLIRTYSRRDTNRFAPNGWRDWLRPNSFKSFIVVTDDRSDRTPQAFESELFGLSPAGTFGTAEERNYVFHSIIGIRSKNPPTEAYGPDEPIVNAACGTARRPDVSYETLSRMTGGLRFPVCETESYDAVFRAAAADVIERARVSCEFTPPGLTPGQLYDRAYVEYRPSDGGSTEYFLEVTDASSCTDKAFVRHPTTNHITLCPSTCSKLEADEEAEISVRFSCAVPID